MNMKYLAIAWRDVLVLVNLHLLGDLQDNLCITFYDVISVQMLSIMAPVSGVLCYRDRNGTYPTEVVCENKSTVWRIWPLQPK